jgi:uncharacterized protein
MAAGLDLCVLAEKLRRGRGLTAKNDIGPVVERLGLSTQSAIPVGDDCAAIPDGDAFLLFAIEGFINEFVSADPWFAGWCGVMVNVSDVAAMGGRPVAIVNAVWAEGGAKAAPLLDGLRAAAEAFGAPIVGGHANLQTDRGQLSVSILGRAKNLLTSFDARPGDRLIAAVDLRGGYREPFANWDAATSAPPARLRGDIALLPQIADAGLCRAAKDISQAGLVGTAAMLAECSGVAIDIDIRAIPKPESAPWDRWLMTFPSFGYLLSAPPSNVAAIIRRFAERDIAAADIGAVHLGSAVTITDGAALETICDFSKSSLITPAKREAAA